MEINKQIICRACALPKEGELAGHWESLKALIAESSQALSEQLDPIGSSDLDKLDQRTRISVLRYFNRAKFRPIPYGEFATVGLLPIDSEGNGEPILSDQKVVLSLRDWTGAKGLVEEDRIWADELLWRRQATLYTYKGVHYFFQATEGQTELFSLAGFEELDQLLEFCSVTRRTKALRKLAGADWPFFRELLSQLLELQVLVHSQQPNLTGQDYFQRLGAGAAENSKGNYAISFRHGHRGFRDVRLEKELASYVAFAQQNLPSPALADLSKFKQQFTSRYENQWQPLVLVLDPNQGLGYAGLSNAGQQDIAALLPKPEDGLQHLILDELSSFLLKGMISGQTIDLKDFKGGEVAQSELPNTLSVLLQPTDGGAWLVEHIGGSSATALLGRFAKDPALFSFASGLAHLEQEANPGVKFFDIAYQTGERTDNINRRPQLYELELALGGWSTHPNQLQLSDLFINVLGGDLVLYSAAHQCRVVPRMASAYNILRASHPLLRLLADLQYQGLHHQFIPDLQQHFPGLDYYPPLKFGQLLLQPANWKIPLSAKVSRTAMDQWLMAQKVDRFVRIGRADQYLCLDLQKEMDRELLWDALQRDAKLHAVSAWAAGADLGMADRNAERFAYQLQFTLTHQQQNYVPVSSFEKPTEQASYPIGGNWLFVSLYTSPENQPNVLKELVGPLLSRYAHLVENWFYILYSDPEKHIRLRIQWRQEVPAALRWSIMGEIGSWITQHGIRDTVVRPYAPEWQRYGVETMGLVERFFALDSREALAEMALEEAERLVRCDAWIWEMLSYALADMQRKKLFLERMATMFAHEMGWDKASFKILNQYWRNSIVSHSEISLHSEMMEVWEAICLSTSAEKQEQLLADLIHMHVNRRFPEHARVREAQLYQYLLLYFKRVSKLNATVPLALR
jgi:thiopeptide-type bacteriocin biosynthesis protein